MPEMAHGSAVGLVTLLFAFFVNHNRHWTLAGLAVAKDLETMARCDGPWSNPVLLHHPPPARRLQLLVNS